MCLIQIFFVYRRFRPSVTSTIQGREKIGKVVPVELSKVLVLQEGPRNNSKCCIFRLFLGSLMMGLVNYANRYILRRKLYQLNR